MSENNPRDKAVALLAKRLVPEYWEALDWDDIDSAVRAALPAERNGLVEAIKTRNRVSVGDALYLILRDSISRASEAEADGLIVDGKVNVGDIVRLFGVPAGTF